MFCFHNWLYYLSWIRHRNYPYGITCLVRECGICKKTQMLHRKDNKDYPVPFDKGKKIAGKWKQLVVPIYPRLNLSEMANKINNKLGNKPGIIARNLKHISTENKVSVETIDKVPILDLVLVEDDVWEVYLPEWQYGRDADFHLKEAFIDADEAFSYAIKTIVRYNAWKVKRERSPSGEKDITVLS